MEFVGYTYMVGQTMAALAQSSGAAFQITFAHVASPLATCALTHFAHLMFAVLLLQSQTFSDGRVSQEFLAWVQPQVLLFWACQGVSSFSVRQDQHLVTRAVKHWLPQNQEGRILLLLTGLRQA